jgi:hypothetical protein
MDIGIDHRDFNGIERALWRFRSIKCFRCHGDSD